MNEDLTDRINRIITYTNDDSCRGIVEETLRKYNEIYAKIGKENPLPGEPYESLLWVAETTRSSSCVETAAKYFLLDEVVSLPQKYSGNVLVEVFLNITTIITDTARKKRDPEFVKKYVDWINNGWVSRLLHFVSEFPGNGNIKIQKDVFLLLASLLDVDVAGLDRFNELALHINRKRKLVLEKKLELLILLVSLICSKREEYAKSLLDGRINYLKRKIENELGTKLSNTFYTLNCGIRFLEDMNEDANILFLFKKSLEFNGIDKWLFRDEITKRVIEELESHGLNANLYIASGKIISQKRASGLFSQNLADVIRRLVIEIVGSKKNNILPRISIPGKRPGSIFRRIKDDYLLALNQDKEAMKKLIETLKELIVKGFEGRKMPKSASQILTYIKNFESVLAYGGAFTYRGARVIAKVWKRKIPDDLYDSHQIWCCWFLPRAETNEIALLMMDPKTTVLQFFTQGITNPISVAFFYAGTVNKEPALLVDTWEGGGFVYSALGQEKMKEFVLESMKKFAKKVNAKRLLIFANPSYGRAPEFTNYLKEKGFKAEKIYFEAIDVEDSVLKAYSQGNKNHTTDAFHLNPLKGCVEAFVLDLT